jgi:hypothetical protein
MRPTSSEKIVREVMELMAMMGPAETSTSAPTQASTTGRMPSFAFTTLPWKVLPWIIF